MSLWQSRQSRQGQGVEAAANENRALMCSAHGCPMRWSVKIESPLCSYHALEPAHKWPQVSDELCRSGPWLLRKDGDSPTVKDMKTRLRNGGKFDHA